MPLDRATANEQARAHPPRADAQGAHAMACMEVWGGYGRTEQGVHMPGLDVWALSVPHGQAEAGGDVHYLSSCGTGRISRVLMADISGHGVKMAPIAGELRGLMRRFVNHIDQRRFVEQLNAEFSRRTRDGVFATAIAASYFAPSRLLSLILAGHPRPLLFGARRGAWRVLSEEPARAEAGGTPGNLPLGVFEDTPYGAVQLRAEVGDLCVIYSDSLIEAIGPDGRQLGVEGLARLLDGLDASRPERLAGAIYGAVRAWSGRESLDDDATVLVLRPVDGPVQAGFAQRLGASLKFVGMALRRLVGGEELPWPEASRANIAGALIKRLGAPLPAGVGSF